MYGRATVRNFRATSRSSLAVGSSRRRRVLTGRCQSRASSRASPTTLARVVRRFRKLASSLLHLCSQASVRSRSRQRFATRSSSITSPACTASCWTTPRSLATRSRQQKRSPPTRASMLAALWRLRNARSISTPIRRPPKWALQRLAANSERRLPLCATSPASAPRIKGNSGMARLPLLP